MKEILLTKGQIALVDDEDYDRICEKSWHARWSKFTKSFYATSNGYRNNKRMTIYMSREIMNTPDDLVCDHINHDTLDNRKENLRNVTRAQNVWNRDNLSHISKNKKGYQVRVTRNGKETYKWCSTYAEALCVRNTLMESVEK